VLRRLLAVAVAALASASTASAQSPETVYDHDSPAGVQYQVPLERARGEAAGVVEQGSPKRSAAHRRPAQARPPSGAVAASPLFGVGISPRDAGRRASGGARQPETLRSSGRPKVPLPAAVESGDLVIEALAGSVFAVLAVGAGIGLLARRSRRRRLGG
jgi:hypothetical protein